MQSPQGLAVLSLVSSRCCSPLVLSTFRAALGGPGGVLMDAWLLLRSRHCATCSCRSTTDTETLQMGQVPSSCQAQHRHVSLCS